MSYCEPCTDSWKVRSHDPTAFVYSRFTEIYNRSLLFKETRPWLFTCECTQMQEQYEDIQWRKIWITENPLNPSNICPHILICIAAKILTDQDISQHNACPTPLSAEKKSKLEWAKEQLKDTWSSPEAIVEKLRPNIWFNTWGEIRETGGFIHIRHKQDYHVKHFKNKKWSCTCTKFRTNHPPHTNCEHIFRVKILESRLQNRREMCINFAQKFIECNT